MMKCMYINFSGISEGAYYVAIGEDVGKSKYRVISISRFTMVEDILKFIGRVTDYGKDKHTIFTGKFCMSNLVEQLNELEYATEEITIERDDNRRELIHCLIDKGFIGGIKGMFEEACLDDLSDVPQYNVVEGLIYSLHF